MRLPPGACPEQQRAAVGDAVARVGELAAAGKLTDAARAWAEFVFHGEEVAALESAGYPEATGRYVPVLLNDYQQRAGSPKAPPLPIRRILGRISAPCSCCTERTPSIHSHAACGTWPTTRPTCGTRDPWRRARRPR